MLQDSGGSWPEAIVTALSFLGMFFGTMFAVLDAAGGARDCTVYALAAAGCAIAFGVHLDFRGPSSS